MKKNNLLIPAILIQLALSSTLSASENSKKSNPFDFSAEYYADMMLIRPMPASSRAFYVGNMDMHMGIDTRKAGLWKGGRFYAYIFSRHGHSPSTVFLKDIQGVSNIETSYDTRVLALYYAHSFKNLKIIAGQHDVMALMPRCESMPGFLNTSFGVQPDMSLNSPASTLTATAPGISALWSIGKNLELYVAGFDGNAGGKAMNPHGIRYTYKMSDGFFTASALHYKIASDSIVKGGLALGSWHHTASFVVADNPDLLVNGNSGFFVSAWHNIMNFMNEDGQLIGFARYGNAIDNLNLVQESFTAGFGVHLLGNKLLPEMIGAGITRVNLNSSMLDGGAQSANHESVLEFTFMKSLHENISLQPDFQYVLNVGGEKGKNAAVGILRFVASF